MKARLIESEQGCTYQVPGGVMVYRDVANLLECSLTPVVMVRDLAAGNWLLHTSMEGKPHCFGIVVEPLGAVAVHSGGIVFRTDLQLFGDMLANAMYRHNMVLFKVNDPAAPEASLLPFLDLQA